MQNQRSKFSLDEDAIYLNCAYMSPQLKTVEEAGIEALRRKNKPNQVTGEHFFRENEEIRAAYASLINSEAPERIVLIPSVSYGMANVANNLVLEPGENVIIAGEQFPSNVYPWMEVCKKAGAELRIVDAPSTNRDRGKNWNQRILESINSHTKLVAISHVHWADGTLFDLEQIRTRTRDVDALLVIDGTQSVGAYPFDMQKYQPDALICAGYKWLMGPYSIGLAHYGPAFDEGRPVENNWINRLHSEDFTGLVNYQDKYQPGALRYEVGERSNFILLPMMHTAIKQLLEWSIDEIQHYCADLAEDRLSKLKSAGYRIEDRDYRASHLFGIRLPEHLSMDTVKEALSEAHIFVSYRGDCIRVAPHVYNTPEEMNTLTEILMNLNT